MTASRSGDPRLTTEEYWDAQWESIRLPYRVDARRYWWRTFDRLFRRLLPQGDLRFLEVGCGACEWLIYFDEVFHYRTYGVDNSTVACQVGQRNMHLTGLNVSRVVRGDIDTAPFAPRTFDVVLSAGVVEHFVDYPNVLGKMAALLSPGGYLVTTVPNFAGWTGWLRKIESPETYAMHVPIREAGLKDAYANAGLVDVEVGHFGSFRIPRGSNPGDSDTSGRLAGGLSTIRKSMDRLLTTAYSVSGHSIESSWLSNGLYAIGRRQQ